VPDQRGTPLDEYHRAGHEITNGNPEVYKRLCSRRDELTVANPFGHPARGWSEVSATSDRAAPNYRNGEVIGFDNVCTVITAGMAYAVEIDRYRAQVGRAWETIRVTTILQREADRWKVVHRHADPTTPPSTRISNRDKRSGRCERQCHESCEGSPENTRGRVDGTRLSP
jgi:hypothetical protein